MSSTEALKKPQVAYFLWQNANREKIQKLAGAKDFKTVAAKSSELWKVASDSEKAPFEAEAKQQKEKYEAFVQTEEGKKALQEKKAGKKEEKEAKDQKESEKAKKREEKETAKEMRGCKAAVKAIEKDEKLKKPLSAYFAWLNDNRGRIAAMLDGKGGPQVTKKGAEMWKTLAEKEKKPYEDRAKTAKEDYDAYIATPEGAAALKAYRDAASAVAYKEKVVDDEAQDESLSGATAKQEEKEEEAKKVTTPKKRSKPDSKPEEVALSAKKAKGRGNGKTTASPQGPDIDAEVMKQATKLAMDGALKNLASRQEVSHLSADKLLVALQKHGGLVNKAKQALLGV